MFIQRFKKKFVNDGNPRAVFKNRINVCKIMRVVTLHILLMVGTQTTGSESRNVMSHSIHYIPRAPLCFPVDDDLRQYSYHFTSFPLRSAIRSIMRLFGLCLWGRNRFVSLYIEKIVNIFNRKLF